MGIPRTLGLLWLAAPGGGLASDTGEAQALGAFLLRMGAWSPSATFFALGSTIFSWLLLRVRMIPALLAWLGVVASVLVVVILPLQLAGLLGSPVDWSGTVTWVIWLPMLVFEVALAFWLLIRGVAAQPTWSLASIPDPAPTFNHRAGKRSVRVGHMEMPHALTEGHRPPGGSTVSSVFHGRDPRPVLFPSLCGSGDATATARNITASEATYRVAILTGFVTLVLFIFLVVILYKLLKAVDKGLARLMVLLVTVGVAVALANLLTKFAPLVLLSSADYLSVFTKPQLDALALGFLRFHSSGAIITMAFWGLWLFPFGALVTKSGFLPRILGVLLLVAGGAYLVSSVTSLVLPDYRQVVSRVMMPLYCGRALWGRAHALRGAGKTGEAEMALLEFTRAWVTADTDLTERVNVRWSAATGR